MKSNLFGAMGLATDPATVQAVFAEATRIEENHPLLVGMFIGDTEMLQSVFRAMRNVRPKQQGRSLEEDLRAIGVTDQTLLACAMAYEASWEFSAVLRKEDGKRLRCAEIRQFAREISRWLLQGSPLSDAVTCAADALRLIVAPPNRNEALASAV